MSAPMSPMYPVKLQAPLRRDARGSLFTEGEVYIMPRAEPCPPRQSQYNQQPARYFQVRKSQIEEKTETKADADVR
ncbi:hypothetical protein DSL72_002608 [Monilinia vaccinii-corymbosi]|uniref:Uncharacterized protein n=1 Tax=Monilinia vaccinii-corymbosi TaxID=61207 RepID=A0A8A3PD69_9HELO|nr:hypothetical protein DSL72_002608 [Monilinia vaccinii-corymbosi]